MGANSAIQWTDHTFNAVEGCEKVSPGCKHCYAEARNNRFSGGANWGPGSPRLLRSPSYWLAPKKWNKEAEKAGVRRRVFAGSLCDVCEDHPDWVGPRKQLAKVVLETPWLDWLFVTKRPENYRRLWDPFFGDTWPRNVWPGCTVENQEEAERRIPHLVLVPAMVHFLSMEPLLEAVDLGFGVASPNPVCVAGERCPAIALVDWIIVGGESGKGARPFDLAWMRSLRDQARAAGIAFFPKQLGARPVESIFRDMSTTSGGSASALIHTSNVSLDDSHGGDESEWPFDLHGLRAFPVVPT